MKYCSIPKTGERISRLGLSLGDQPGFSSSEQEKIVQASVEAGVNYLDIKAAHDGLAQSIRSMRERLMIQVHFGSAHEPTVLKTCQTGFKLAERNLKHQLGLLGLGHADFAVIGCGHDENIDEVIHGGMLDYAVRQRDAGLIRYLAFCAGSADSVRTYLQTGAFDWAMISIDMVGEAFGNGRCDSDAANGTASFLEELADCRVGFAVCDSGCRTAYANANYTHDRHGQVKRMRQAMHIPGARTVCSEVCSFDDTLQAIKSFETASEDMRQVA